MVEGDLHEGTVVLQAHFPNGLVLHARTLFEEVGDGGAVDAVGLAQTELQGGESLPLALAPVPAIVVPVLLDLHLLLLPGGLFRYWFVDCFYGFEILHVDLLHLGIRFLLAHADELPVAGVDDGYRYPFLPRPAGTADPVQIGLGIDRQVEVYDEIHIGDVEAPGGHIGGEQDQQTVVPEVADDPLPELLGHVPVQGTDLDTLVLEFLVDGVHHQLGGEKYYRLGVPFGQDLVEDVLLLVPLAGYDVLFGEPGGGRVAGDVHLGGIVEHLLGEPPDLAVQGGGKQQGLVDLGHILHYEIDIVLETHVQHAVRLVEHDLAYLAEVEGFPLDHVLQPAGCSHDDVRSASEGCDLPLDGGSAVDSGAHVA